MDDREIKAFEELQKTINEPLTPNSLIYIYQRIRVLTEIPSRKSSLLHYPPLIRALRFFLADRDREVRVAALRTLRYMALNEEVLNGFASAKIQHFVVRCFETEGKNQEKIEACKFIKNWLEISPKNFPGSFMNALIALAETESEDLKEFAVEVIRILCISNPKLVALHGGIKVLISSLSDGQILLETQINTILTIIFLLNTTETRTFLSNYSEILKIFAVFTSTDNIYNENEFNCLLSLSKQAIKTMCRSWVGLFFLASKCFRPIFQCLTLPTHIKVKVTIIETLEDILNIPIETGQGSQNLLKNYLALMIRALIDSDLIRCLNFVVQSEGQKLGVRCRTILKKIFIFASDLLPANTLEMLNTLTPYSEVSEKRVVCDEKNSNFLYLTCEFLSKEPCNCIESNSVVARQIYKNYSINTLDSFSIPDLVKSSKIIESLNKWDWEIITSLLSAAEQKQSIFSQLLKERFFFFLLNYYSLSKKDFASLPYHPKNFKKASLGWRLITLLSSHEDGLSLLLSPPSDNFFLVRSGFIEEIKFHLSLELSPTTPKSRLFTKENIASTMSREYIKWVSLLTHSPSGKTLLTSTGLDMVLLNLSTVPHISSVILLYLDYTQQLSKDFISISLQSPSNTLKQISIQQILLIHKAGNLDLSWAVKELVSLFHYPEHDTAKAALRAVQELCKDPNCLQAFIETGPQDLSKLGEEGKNCLISLLSSEDGVRYLLRLNFIRNELESWTEHGHEGYIFNLEQKSEAGLNFNCKSYALEVFCPFSFYDRDHSDGLWLSRVPFFIAVRVPTRSSAQWYMPGVIQSEDNDVFITSFDSSITLNEGEILEVCLMVGHSFISNQGHECETGNWTRFDLSTYTPQKSSGLILRHTCHNSQYTLKSCSFRIKVHSKAYQKIDFPLHLYKELVKTETGLKVLKDSIRVEEFLEALRGDQSILNKRVAVWALANVGTSEIGARYLEELQAVGHIVRLAEESEVLSLRGAAFQALCLISSTKTGKKMLENENWLVSRANVAVPRNCKRMFELDEPGLEVLFDLKARNIDEGMEKIRLGRDEMRVVENILNISNFAKKQEAEDFIRSKRHNSPELFENLKIFNATMEHLGLFNFNLKSRKMIHKIFDKLHKKQAHLDELDRH